MTRRVALLVSTFLLLSTVFGTSQAAAADRAPCFVVSNRGFAMEYLCDTRLDQFRFSNGVVIDVAIGVDRRVYNESGGGWRQIGNGEVNHNAFPQQVGIFPTSTGIRVFGTDGRDYCNDPKPDRHWKGWERC